MFYGFNKHCGVKCVGEQTEKKDPVVDWSDRSTRAQTKGLINSSR